MDSSAGTSSDPRATALNGIGLVSNGIPDRVSVRPKYLHTNKQIKRVAGRMKKACCSLLDQTALYANSLSGTVGEVAVHS